jgi:hypothetical protein
MAGDMEFDDIVRLRANSMAWRLLRADNGPLVLSFLHRVFVEENVRAIPATELVSRLDDQLYALNERESRSFPRSAREYLDDWASPESGRLPSISSLSRRRTPRRYAPQRVPVACTQQPSSPGRLRITLGTGSHDGRGQQFAQT